MIEDVTLRVRDLDRVAGFYRDVLGLSGGTAGGVARLGAGGAPFLHLVSDPRAAPGDPAGAGLFHTAFLLPSRAALGGFAARLRARRTPVDGAADHLVSEAIYLHDPEGNGVEVYADKPAEQWSWSGPAGERRVGMANARLDWDGLLGLPWAWDGAPVGTRIGHVHLRVGDIPAAREFYAGRLGFDVTAGWDAAAFLSRDGYHHHLAVNTWHSAGATPRADGDAGLVSVTLCHPALPPGEHRDPWNTLVRINPTHTEASP